MSEFYDYKNIREFVVSLVFEWFFKNLVYIIFEFSII